MNNQQINKQLKINDKCYYYNLNKHQRFDADQNLAIIIV